MSVSASVGINLAGTNYWGTEFPFINRIKDSSGWLVFYANGTRAAATAAQLDTDGYLENLPTGATAAVIQVEVDPVSLAMPDRYVLTYDGTASFRLIGGTVVSSEPGKIVFDITAYSASGMTLQVTNATGLKDLAFVRSDQVDLYISGEIFNPVFVDRISEFSTLRYMDWGATNNSTLVNWEDRPKATDRSWITSEGGVPIETMVALANESHTNMWVNIPFNANDDFVTQEMTYIRDNLDPTLKVNVEFSNEVWNWGFDQSRTSMTKGDLLWGTDANGDGKINPNDSKEHYAYGWVQYYGYRAAQVANLANAVFAGNPDQLDNVFSAKGQNWTQYMIAGVNAAGVGTMSSLFDTLSTDGYFAGFGTGNAADINTIISWAKGGAAGVNAAFNALENGGSLSYDASIGAATAKFVAMSAIANTYGLDLAVYEGGFAVVTNGMSAANAALVQDFYTRLVNDPRMGDLYTKLVDSFSAAGGDLFNAYNDASPTTGGGIWGTLSNIYQEHSVRYDALVALANGGAATPSDWILGGAGADTLYGTSGDDNIDGSGGDDRMIGYAGDDIYMVDSVKDVVVEAVNEGIDTIVTNVSGFGLAANIENLTYSGTSAFSGYGNELANTITGGIGGDTLDGGLGADTLIGGKGNDIYRVDNAGDVVVEVAGEGYDWILTSVSYSLAGTDVERIDASRGTAAINLIGNALGNEMRGNDGANTISGGNGDDNLRGHAGNDILMGDAGNDVLYGGADNDVLIGGAGRDLLYGEAGADTFKFTALSDLTAVSGSTDQIYAFETSDRIDVSAIDAIAGGGDNAFTFIDTAAFGKKAGELRIQGTTGHWDVMGDVNGDGVADFAISVYSPTAPNASNFIL